MVYAGIASNCLSASIEAAKKYFDLGVDAVVAHLPSYYPLAPDNMLRYFEDLAERVRGPLLLYNIPITTHISIPLDVIEKLSHHPKIVGLKNSENDPERMEEESRMCRDRSDFAHLCGCAVLSAKALLAGSDGVVPSTANFAPKPYREMYDAAVRGDADTTNRLQEETNELGKIYQKGRILSQSLPALKVIMSELGLCGDNVLAPLYRVSAEERAAIKDQLAKAGVIK
jgi:4-hydroxy-tetrahydrodipicolinate synthase